MHLGPFINTLFKISKAPILDPRMMSQEDGESPLGRQRMAGPPLSLEGCEGTQAFDPKL